MSRVFVTLHEVFSDFLQHAELGGPAFAGVEVVQHALSRNRASSSQATHIADEEVGNFDGFPRATRAEQ
jgi:hypothetical protein